MKSKKNRKLPARVPMKTAKNDRTPTGKRIKTRPATPEQKYLQIFTPHPLPYQGLYTEEDSLEQPSELQEIPSTSSPFVEA
jgi:hypothetical protein